LLTDRSGQPIRTEDLQKCLSYGIDPQDADDIDELMAHILIIEQVAEYDPGRYTLDTLIEQLKKEL
jgi:hypothetical protein